MPIAATTRQRAARRLKALRVLRGWSRETIAAKSGLAVDDITAIEQANQFIIDRDNPRQHTAFGFGVHRCVGNRLAEMQLNIIWEEIMKRFSKVEVTGEPLGLASSFIHGIRELPVTLRE